MSQEMVLTSQAASQLNDMGQFLSWRPTWLWKQFVMLPQRKVVFFSGNQYGKTSGWIYSIILRLFGSLPVPEKNVLYFECESGEHRYGRPAPWPGLHWFGLADGECFMTCDGERKGYPQVVTFPKDMKCVRCGGKLRVHERGSRILRLGGQTLPAEKEGIGKDSAEVGCRTYPEFKKWLPPFLMKRDILVGRSYVMIVKDPNEGCVFGEGPDAISWPGKDINIEFVAYSQQVQSGAGAQRVCVYNDEEPPWEHYEEQLPRLLMENGDYGMGLTPANRMCFDEETEILTRRGWLRYDSLMLSDQVMTYSIDKDQMEWGGINGFVLSDYNGGMVRLHHNAFDFLVTPEHTWCVCNDRKHNSLYKEQTARLNTKHIIKRISTNVHIPYENKTWTEEECALVGWIVTDGTISSGKAVIYQSKSAYPKHCEEIDGLVKNNQDDVTIREHDYGGQMVHGRAWNGSGVCRRWDFKGDLRIKLRSVILPGKGLNKEWICSLSTKQLEALFNAMVGGDGCLKPNGSVIFTQTHNEELISDFNLIATLLGRLCRTSVMFTSDSKRHYAWVYASKTRNESNTHFKALKKDVVQYSGKIWCPSVSNGFVVVRRNGTVSISGNTWTYQEMFEEAELFIRTKAICDFYARTGEETRTKRIERIDGKHTGIVVLQAATDDNPMLDPNIIKEILNYTDDDTEATRRYGIHRQATGRVFKNFDRRIHCIDPGEYFPHWIPHFWVHGRGIDVHPRVPWACGAASVSPQNEIFIWYARNLSPEKMSTLEIMRELAEGMMDYKFDINLCDPLAKAIVRDQKSVLDEMRRITGELKREGIGTGGYWVPWDTKSDVGREGIRTRLANSRLVGRPFNNKTDKGYLPTIWLFKGYADEAEEHMRKWSYKQHGDSSSMISKDSMDTEPNQVYSHMNMVWEALLKHTMFRPRTGSRAPEQKLAQQYFKRGR